MTKITKKFLLSELDELDQDHKYTMKHTKDALIAAIETLECEDTVEDFSSLVALATGKYNDYILSGDGNSMVNIDTGVRTELDTTKFKNADAVKNSIAAEWETVEGAFTPYTEEVLIPWSMNGKSGTGIYQLGFDDVSELPLIFKIKRAYGEAQEVTQSLGYTNTLAYVLKNMADDEDYENMLRAYKLTLLKGAFGVLMHDEYIINIGEYHSCKKITEGREVQITSKKVKRQF